MKFNSVINVFFRGKNDAKTKKAFRGHYARVGEERSLLPAFVPLVVMTATVTAAARRDIVKLTGMHNNAEVVLSPNRRNIRYSVIHLQKFNLYAAFTHIIDDIESNTTSAERVIVYCRKKEHCSDLINYFQQRLERKVIQIGHLRMTGQECMPCSIQKHRMM
jgi:superfamily II DNA helicase RecQ